ncbi:hypothetical protein H920_01033 [Fukomys damarensis]|uniref:Uncharacterized protein n=1 Tax=Fukomys damarensis TaxID=885580 RepID=A0A091E4A0_FUKDA|nr:hypothetical protein H920_01033 [Fukomys damarensis]
MQMQVRTSVSGPYTHPGWEVGVVLTAMAERISPVKGGRRVGLLPSPQHPPASSPRLQSARVCKSFGTGSLRPSAAEVGLVQRHYKPTFTAVALTKRRFQTLAPMDSQTKWNNKCVARDGETVRKFFFIFKNVFTFRK